MTAVAGSTTAFAPYSAPRVVSTESQAHPVPHTRVRGVFDGTDVEFSIYLPPRDGWEGRFFQYTYPMPIPGVYEGPDATERAVRFALTHGGYAVQAGNANDTVLGFAHAAAAALFAREYARSFYALPEARIHGYLYGPSGGSFQTVGAMELTDGIWDGFVPMVLGTPVSIPGNFFIRAMARLILEDRAEQIADAVRPGGSGDPFAGLDQAEAAMLEEMLAYGTPLCAWESPRYVLSIDDLDGKPLADPLMGMGGVVRAMDPTYVDDFWSAPGYLGTEGSPLGMRVRELLAERGDTEDNRWALALPSYYRHQVPLAGPDMYGFDQFRDEAGRPLYPQRSVEVGPIMQQQTTGGATYSGEFSGKVIVVDTLGDSDALPWHADWYASRVGRVLGTDVHDRFRLYFQESSDHHEQPVAGYRATHLVGFLGTVEQALVDLAAWVEDDVPAPASTNYRVEGAQIAIDDGVEERGGIQPIVDLDCHEGDADGEWVLSARAVPLHGEIVEVAWDLEGEGTFVPAPFDTRDGGAIASVSHVFEAGRVWLPAVRVTSHRAGSVEATTCRVQNLMRVRVDRS